MRLTRTIWTTVGAVTVALSLASATQAAVLIDNFSVGAYELTAEVLPGTLTQNSLPTSGVIGGVRYAELFRNSGFLNVKANMNGANGTGTPGAYIIDSQFVNSARATLAYGTAADLNANMTVGGNNSIGIAFISADVPATVEVKVVSNGVEGSQTLLTAGAGELFFNFVDFVPTGAGSLNFTDIDFVEFTFTGAQGGDYTIDLLQATVNPDGPQAIPSPAAAWVGLALVGGILARRRRAAA